MAECWGIVIDTWPGLEEGNTNARSHHPRHNKRMRKTSHNAFLRAFLFINLSTANSVLVRLLSTLRGPTRLRVVYLLPLEKSCLLVYS